MANKSQRIKISARNIYVTEARLSIRFAQQRSNSCIKYCKVSGIISRSHIFMKRKALGLQLSKLLFLLKRKSPLTIENKLLIYTI